MTNTKFKIGDQVRIAPSSQYYGLQGVGQIGKIEKNDEQYWVRFDVDEYRNTYDDYDLELATPRTPPTKEEMLESIKKLATVF